jgi:hypothetical protein
VRVKIVAQLENDQLTPSWLMVHDHPTRIGKTTVAACVGSIFAQVRHDDRWPSTPTPRSASWVPGRPVHDRVVLGPSRAADEHLDTFADVR